MKGIVPLFSSGESTHSDCVALAIKASIMIYKLHNSVNTRNIYCEVCLSAIKIQN